MKIAFWISLFIIFYTYIGYAIAIYVMGMIKRVSGTGKKHKVFKDYFPTLTLLVAAYNEEQHIEDKISNCLELIYPPEKLEILFITDGSTDATPGLLSTYPQIKLMHTPLRSGKIHAINRAMEEVKTDIVVFTDANTYLNKNALVNLTRHFADEEIGAVAGEKRIIQNKFSDATAGEGFYWKYESRIKKWESDLYSVVGAAGELYSIRRALYEPVPQETVLDDLIISLRIAVKGHRIIYEPNAYAVETSSVNTKEELKRKIRIAAGGIQSVFQLKFLLNPFKYPALSFQYISHRVLRWTITPLLIIISLLLNVIIVLLEGDFVYTILLITQIIFYTMALLGWILAKKETGNKFLFVPFYFCLMNYAMLAGMKRYFSGKQSPAWEKVKRK
ncbi:MAG: glycosyltransferase family 2 protein [Chitinophagaceae bacterium]